MHRDIESGSLPRRSEPQVGRSVIAVVGINDYVRWPRLENAVGDAIGVSRMFRRLGFVELTAPLLDGAATGEAMHRLVTDDLAQLSHDDSLVLFFAGHGHTHIASVGEVSVTTGCVIPVDATGLAGHMSASWLRLDSWLSDIARLPPRHILVIIDACHSGVALSGLHSSRSYRGSGGVRWRGADAAADLDALRARRSRRIITSALDDQRAMDSGPVRGHSLFTSCLIEGLSGRLTGGGRRIATGTEVGLYLQKRVAAYSLSTQTPDFGPFELDDRGEIVVPILSDAAPTGPEPRSEPQLDVPVTSVRSDVWTRPIHLRCEASKTDVRLTPIAVAGQGLAIFSEPVAMRPELRPENTLKGVAPAPLPASPPPVALPWAASGAAALPDDAVTLRPRGAETERPTALPPAPDRGFYDPSRRPAPRARTVELAVVLIIVGLGTALGYTVVGPLIRGTSYASVLPNPPGASPSEP